MLQLENGNIFILLQPLAIGRRLVAGFFGLGLGGKPNAILLFDDIGRFAPGVIVFFAVSGSDKNFIGFYSTIDVRCR